MVRKGGRAMKFFQRSPSTSAFLQQQCRAFLVLLSVHALMQSDVIRPGKSRSVGIR